MLACMIAIQSWSSLLIEDMGKHALTEQQPSPLFPFLVNKIDWNQMFDLEQ